MTPWPPSKGTQSVILPVIAGFDGRVIDTVGDGVVAEFASVLNAVKCAVAIQETMLERPTPGRCVSRFERTVVLIQSETVNLGRSPALTLMLFSLARQRKWWCRTRNDGGRAFQHQCDIRHRCFGHPPLSRLLKIDHRIALVEFSDRPYVAA